MPAPRRKWPVPLLPSNGSGTIGCWVHHWGRGLELKTDALSKELAKHNIEVSRLGQNAPSGAGVCVFGEPTLELRNLLQAASRGGNERIIAIADEGRSANGSSSWNLLYA